MSTRFMATLVGSLSGPELTRGGVDSTTRSSLWAVDGAKRTKALRDRAWAAHRAAQEARDAGQAAASDAARAAGHAVGAAFLHPLANATQVKHILGSAAHAARAFEFSAGDDPTVGADHIAQLRILAHPVVVDILRRDPAAPRGGRRVGELIRQLDASLR